MKKDDAEIKRTVNLYPSYTAGFERCKTAVPAFFAPKVCLFQQSNSAKITCPLFDSWIISLKNNSLYCVNDTVTAVL